MDCTPISKRSVKSVYLLGKDKVQRLDEITIKEVLLFQREYVVHVGKRKTSREEKCAQMTTLYAPHVGVKAEAFGGQVVVAHYVINP